VGFADETWWSRVTPPSQHTWAPPDQPTHLLEQTLVSADPDPAALACYGLLVRQATSTGRREDILLRFVDGRPVSGITTQFLEWCCARLAAQGVQGLLLIWDTASWHRSHLVQQWLHAHNQTVQQEHRGVRIVQCWLPIKSPWLNPIEPKWMHGKRAVGEPAQLLTGPEIADRVCAYYHCPHEDHLSISDELA
jgi:hypothetical protein